MAWKIPDNARSPLAGKQKTEGYPCVICGVVAPNPRYTVNLHGGGSFLANEEDRKNNTLDPAGDMYCYPIGPSCLKKYPELKAGGYVFDSKKGGIIMGKTIVPAGFPFVAPTE